MSHSHLFQSYTVLISLFNNFQWHYLPYIYHSKSSIILYGLHHQVYHSCFYLKKKGWRSGGWVVGVEWDGDIDPRSGWSVLYCYGHTGGTGRGQTPINALNDASTMTSWVISHSSRVYSYEGSFHINLWGIKKCDLTFFGILYVNKKIRHDTMTEYKITKNKHLLNTFLTRW